MSFCPACCKHSRPFPPLMPPQYLPHLNSLMRFNKVSLFLVRWEQNFSISWLWHPDKYENISNEPLWNQSSEKKITKNLCEINHWKNNNTLCETNHQHFKRNRLPGETTLVTTDSPPPPPTPSQLPSSEKGSTPKGHSEPIVTGLLIGAKKV